jgi:hypothetical protein
MSTFGSGTFGGGPVLQEGSAPRFRQRHVHKTLVDYLRNGLVDRGWVTPPINFGTTPVTFMEAQPEEGGIRVPPNTVAITIGDEAEDLDEEMGAGLQSCAYALFVDIYGADNSSAVSIASDIKDLLKNMYLPLRDYTTVSGGAPTEHMIELEDVTVERATTSTGAIDKRFWRIVKAMAVLYFVE